ncbi:hypothetical protein T5B8_03866 [Salinisphaera sp. T5B8]|uniref:hypothetical protein n=1 Tax=Salinisphaera sp. T5B8 TaxID=1304154 RepID=UPI00333F70BD
MNAEDAEQHRPATLSEAQRQRFPLVTDKPETDDAQTYTVFSYLVSAIGLLTLLVGGYFLLFGPEYVRYNVVTGMTFKQILQAYPGPIASLGAVAVAIGQAIGNAGEKHRVAAVEAVVTTALEREQITPEDFGDEYRLSMRKRQDDRLELDLVDVTQ